MNDLTSIGGLPAVRQITDEVVERMASDAMIGFLFRRVDLERLKELEYQHAARFLGAPVDYQGRDLGQAHAPHRIQGGQFARRLEIVRQVLQQYAVDAQISQRWLDHQRSLRSHIVVQAAGENPCL